MSKTRSISAAIAMACAGVLFAQGADAKSPLSKAPQFTAKDCERLSAGSARGACMRAIDGSDPGADSAAAARATGSGTYWHAPSRAGGVLPPDVTPGPNTAGTDTAAIGVTTGAAAKGEVASQP